MNKCLVLKKPGIIQKPTKLKKFIHYPFFNYQLMRIHFIQHVPFEHPAYLLKWAAPKGYAHSISKMYEPHIFPSLNDFDMLVIMGGPMGAYDEDKYAWLKPEKQFIK